VLGQCERIQEILNQSAEELYPANTQAVTTKLQDATERLRAVNQALLAEIRDRTLVDHQLAAAMEQAEGARVAALHDRLTGLPNRVLFEDRLEQGIAHAKRHPCVLAVMFVDLDKFKGINDTFGHAVGDAVLQTVATRLACNTREEDTVSRHGGDEFLCLLTPLQKEEDIAPIAAKMLKAIEAPCEVRSGDVIFNLGLGASIGISVYPRDGDAAQALITRADNAMYRAKQEKSGIAFARKQDVNPQG
jgi:diguanylate cyclase (GGDEF)-like protein